MESRQNDGVVWPLDENVMQSSATGEVKIVIRNNLVSASLSFIVADVPLF